MTSVSATKVYIEITNNSKHIIVCQSRQFCFLLERFSMMLPAQDALQKRFPRACNSHTTQTNSEISSSEKTSKFGKSPRICSKRCFFLPLGPLVEVVCSLNSTCSYFLFENFNCVFFCTAVGANIDNARCTGPKSEMLVFCDEWDVIKHLLIPFSAFPALY